MPTRLNLGCGLDYRPGWVNIDARNDAGTRKNERTAAKREGHPPVPNRQIMIKLIKKG